LLLKPQRPKCNNLKIIGQPINRAASSIAPMADENAAARRGLRRSAAWSLQVMNFYQQVSSGQIYSNCMKENEN
jgi:hypothetical protein